MGDDVTSNTLKLYIAYKKVRNFVCIQLYSKSIVAFLNIDPSSVELEEGFSRDVRMIGHHATGHLEITLRTDEDLVKVKPLIERAYNEG